jgi:hypothetical protein
MAVYRFNRWIGGVALLGLLSANLAFAMVEFAPSPKDVSLDAGFVVPSRATNPIQAEESDRPAPKKISELPESVRKELAELILKKKMRTVENSAVAQQKVQRSPETSSVPSTQR